MAEPELSFADAQLAKDMGTSFKDPATRLIEVEDEGTLFFENNDMEKALAMGRQQLALTRMCYLDPKTQDKEVMMAKAHFNLSAIYCAMTLGEQSLHHAQKALERVDPRVTGHGENNDLTVACMLSVARALIQLSDPKCVNFLQRACLLNHELHGPDDESNFRIHEGFGDFYAIVGDSRALSKAAKEAKEAKEAQSAPSGYSYGVNAKKKPEPSDYDKAMDEYATAYSKISGGNKASAFYGGLMATKDSRMGDMFGNAAKTKSKMGSETEAAVIYEKAVACLEMAAKPDRAKVARMCYELGCSYHKTKQYSYSKSALEKGLSYCSGPGENETDPVRLLLKKQQAITLYDANEVENARVNLEQLLILQKKEYGGTSVIVAETLKYLGDVYVALRNKPLAARFYNRALRVLRKQLGSVDQTVRQLEQYVKKLNL